MSIYDEIFDFSEFDALGRWLGIRKSDEEIEFIAAQNHAYFAPSDEPLQWRAEIRGKLVRLDVAIMAAHVLGARGAHRGVAKVMGGIVSSLKRSIGEWIFNTGLAKLGGLIVIFKGIASAVSAITAIAETVSSISVQRGIEAHIRAESLKAQKELKALALGRSKRRRMTRLVRTRHGGKKQREANKSWHPQS